MFKLRITLEVVNELDEVVNVEGYTNHTKSMAFFPLSTSLNLSKNVSVEQAHKQLNKLYQMLNSLKEML